MRKITYPSLEFKYVGGRDSEARVKTVYERIFAIARKKLKDERSQGGEFHDKK